MSYQTVNSDRQLREYIESISGSECPLCGIDCATYTVFADAKPKSVDDGGIWKTDNSSFLFASLGSETPSFPRSKSKSAAHLRAQLQHDSAMRDRDVCQSLTNQVRAKIALETGVSAQSGGQISAARHAFEVCAATTGSESYHAAFHLGELAEKEGDRNQSARWYREAAKTSEAKLRAAATLYLGISLSAVGDLRGASVAYERCVKCGEDPLQSMAATRLGHAYRSQNRIKRARKAYRLALSLGDKSAAFDLGGLEWSTGHRDRARSLWEIALECSDPEIVSRSAFNLGRFWEQQGVLRKARSYFHAALRSSDERLVAEARARLGARED